MQHIEQWTDRGAGGCCGGRRIAAHGDRRPSRSADRTRCSSPGLLAYFAHLEKEKNNTIVTYPIQIHHFKGKL